MLSALILALGLGVPTDGFVIPTLKRPVPTLPQSSSLFPVPAAVPPERRMPPTLEPAGDVTCTIRAVEAPPVDEEMAREIKVDVDRGMVVTSRCQVPEPQSPEPRR
jgi:hypothetical protein